MTALTLIGYPFGGRPVYLALAPLTHAAGVLCFPVLASGGEIVDHAGARRRRVPGADRAASRDAHFPAADADLHGARAPELDTTDLSSLQCFWYGAAPMSVARLEEALTRIGPVMAQLFGQTEAPMMISMMPPADHFRCRRHDRHATASPRPGGRRRWSRSRSWTTTARCCRAASAARSSSAARWSWPATTRTRRRPRRPRAYGWHHTGDIGYLDDDNYLYIVDRAKDMIITGGFNVYSTEVEQALMAHPAVQDCAVIGLPDDKWGERVVAVVQLQPGARSTPPS